MPDHTGKHAQLANGAAALAFDAGARQAAFSNAAIDQGVPQRHHLVGDRVQESGTRGQRRFTVGVEGVMGQHTGAVKIGKRGAAK